jgi:ketosteroid isomerase-like protein
VSSSNDCDTCVVTIEILAAFADAWNLHDVDALMSFMSEDCVFQTAAGPQACGTRISGHAAVREAFAAAWKVVTDAQWINGVHFVSGDFGTSQWTFTGTAPDGSRIETDGIDVFTFKAGKIALKNVFRKARPNLPAPK